MLFALDQLQLSDEDLLAKGGHRNVYAYPDQPGLLVKVTRPRIRKNRSLAKRMIRRLLPDSHYRNALKEIECEMQAALKGGSDIARLPLARCFGVAQTNFGPGVVVEKVMSAEGTLADHLADLTSGNGLSADLLAQLNEFVQRLFQLQIVGRDIHEKNIVHGVRDQVPMFFLIDGYGERNLVPLRSLSRTLNDRSLNKQMHSIAAKVGLRWDKSSRAFTTS